MERIEEGLIQSDVLLSPLTTLGCGGLAKFFLRADTAGKVRYGLSWAEKMKQPLFVLGGGSNVIISDSGFPGLVIQMAVKGIHPTASPDGSVLVAVGGGEELDAFVLFCVQKGWSGVECLSGIPGSVGAVPVQNVGAYGQEVSETIESVTVIDRTTLQTDVIRAADCGFAYRSSIFKNQAGRDRFVVIGVQFRLKPGGIPQIRYAELDREFSKCDPVQREAAPLAVVRECVLKLRRRKSMVIDPLDPNTRSVGSFFLNPVVSHADFDRLRALWLREHPEAVVPSFPAPGGQVKLSAAWLVEQAGFSKGFVSGGAGLSTNHALALINRGGGSGDILALASRIEKAVEALFNVRLQREPVLVG